MSKMSQIHMEISDQLLQGIDPRKIARTLSVPTDWVFAVEANLDQDADNYDAPEQGTVDNNSFVY